MTRILLIGLMAFFAIGRAPAATIYAGSVSYADVSNAVASASHGDTVRIPEGAAEWSTYLYVTKALSIIGAGTNSTHLTRTNGLLFWLRPSTNLPIRVSQIQFTGGWNDEIIYIDAKRESDVSRSTVSSFRVDRCKFNRGKRAIWPLGWAYGVVDHCTFTDCNIAVSPQGDNSAAWARAEGYGTTNSVVIEDNVFVITDSAPSEPNEQIYHYEGGRSTTRFNTFTGANSTNYYTLPLESHGNYGSGITDPGTTNALAVRGQPVIEVYGNTFAARQTYRFIYLRGGSSLIFSNAFTYTHGSVPSVIQLTDEETWQTSFFSPLKTTRPVHDGITNSFYWSNTLNGSAVTTASVSGSDTNVIAANSEYWMQAPNGTNGVPAGVLASYSPLVYPHPRVTAEDSTNTVPTLFPTTLRAGTLRGP